MTFDKTFGLVSALAIALVAGTATRSQAQSVEPVLSLAKREKAPLLDTLKDLVSIETGSRSATTCSTVCPVRNDLPKSPCSTLPSQER